MKNRRGVEPRRGASRRNLGTQVWQCKSLISNIPPKRNDTWVVPYNVTSLTCYTPCRGAIRKEQPAYRSARLTYRFPPHQSGAIAARCNKFIPPQPTKNFPHVPATLQKRNNSSLRKWRGHGGSSGWVREVWRVGRPLQKGSPCASKVFLIPLKLPQTYERQHPCSIPYRFRQESACR